METEKIDVPKFDGFECVGIAVPSGDDYALNHNGTELVHRTDLTSYARSWAQLCYREIKPKRIILESTGEFRAPLEGEYYLSLGLPERANHIFAETAKREILRIVEE